MSSRKHKKLVHEGDYVAEIEVELIESEAAWAPYLSIADARRLDEARLAMRKGDVSAAGRLGRVYRLTPATAA